LELETRKNEGMPLGAKVSLLVACFFWALSFIASKKALEVIPPLMVVTLRLMISSLCFLAWVIIKRKKIKFQGLQWLGHLFILSLFGATLHYAIQTSALEYTTASNASVYAAIGPVSITLLAALFLDEKITKNKALGIGAALTGALVVTGIDTIIKFDLSGNLLGDLLVLSSVVMWGIFTVFGKGMMAKMDAIDFTAMVTFLGTLTMIPLGWYEKNVTSFSLTNITPVAWIAVAFLGITCSFLATLLYFHALEKTESQKVGVYLYTIPPMTTIIAALYLGEVISWHLPIGIVIVLSGVYLTERG
jgi:drug/metabolite transporter (DMT)-like permease